MGRRKNTAEAYEILYRIARERLGENESEGARETGAPDGVRAPAPAPEARPNAMDRDLAGDRGGGGSRLLRGPESEPRSPSAWFERGSFSASPLSPKPRTRPRGIVPLSLSPTARTREPVEPRPALVGPRPFRDAGREELVASRARELALESAPAASISPEWADEPAGETEDRRREVGGGRVGPPWADASGGGEGRGGSFEKGPRRNDGGNGSRDEEDGAGDRDEHDAPMAVDEDVPTVAPKAAPAAAPSTRAAASAPSRTIESGIEDPEDSDLHEPGAFASTLERWRRIAEPAQRVLAPVSRFAAWILGENASRLLSRRIEVRVSTLVMATISLVICLALVGIYLNLMLDDSPYASEPLVIDEEARRQHEASFAQDGGEVIALTELPPAVAFTPQKAAISSAPVDRERPWAPGPDRTLGPEFRGEVSKATLAPSAEDPDLTFNPRRHWIQLRAMMDERERDALYEHVTKVIVPFFNAYASPAGTATSFARKEVVWTPMPDRPHLYMVFVGPFENARDAEVAKRNFESELKSYAQLRFKSYFGDLLAAPESPTIGEYRRRARAAVAANGGSAWTLEAPASER